MKKLPSEIELVVPSKLSRRIRRLARKARRTDEETVNVLLDYAASHIAEEPWFFADVFGVKHG